MERSFASAMMPMLAVCRLNRSVVSADNASWPALAFSYPPRNALLAECAKRISGPLALHASTRYEPVNLSDSRPETHQHWPPAGANCCHSLLLDPDATISIDLHNGWPCWSQDEENSPQDFPYLDALYRLS